MTCLKTEIIQICRGAFGKVCSCSLLTDMKYLWEVFALHGIQEPQIMPGNGKELNRNLKFEENQNLFYNLEYI